jgi:hypothetical protein
MLDGSERNFLREFYERRDRGSAARLEVGHLLSVFMHLFF